MEKELTVNEESEPVRGWGFWVGIFPFCGPWIIVLTVMGIVRLLSIAEDPVQWIANIVMILVIFWYFGVFIAGWIKGFPRWWYPYALYPVLFSIVLQNASSPGLWFFGLSQGRSVWGWRAWVPFILIMLIIALATRSLGPLKQMWRSIWHDPSRLSFALYGILPPLMIVIFDEMDDNFSLPFQVINAVLLLLGAIVYLRSKINWQRLASLYGATLLAMLISTIAVSYYWNGRQDYWMTSPATWQEQAWPMALFTIYLSLLFLGPPLIIDLIRNLKESRPINPKPG
ncbi:MAG: hypothetical protein CVU39_00120 [Chloroflexi bacterium HGW-Chloroflexi-10]|nr:MAG: hypothetical protein CVU39_00120 [Chloroflexi bacterium HGW-Chloroflexi-10]